MKKKKAAHTVKTVMVAPNKPYNKLTELEKRAVDDFGGDLTKTIHTLLQTSENDGLNPYVAGMNKDEALLAALLMKESYIDTYAETAYSTGLQLHSILESLGITEEELVTTDKYPFWKVYKKRVAILAAVLVAAVLFAFLVKSITTVAFFIAAVSIFLIVAYTLATLLQSSHFRKAKKLKAKYDELTKNENKETGA